MTGILAASLDDALRSLGHAVESTSGERQEPGGLLALADRVGRALTGRSVAQNEPVHVIIGNRASAVAAGETGELQICTPFGMLGYLDNPELTDASLDDDYFRTGDLARMTAVGRAKDIISRGGNKIAPLEIDNLLGEHPDVAAALCAGVPDERLGEVIHVVIVPRADAYLDAVALRDWLLARTERFKVPDVFHFRDVLPSGSSGKADRRAVAQLAAQATEVAVPTAAD
jgi:acyl-CoA synthetase (AMP-forming)/AMP-acid ligase II